MFGIIGILTIISGAFLLFYFLDNNGGFFMLLGLYLCSAGLVMLIKHYINDFNFWRWFL